MLITERRSGRRGGVLPDLVAVAGAAMLTTLKELTARGIQLRIVEAHAQSRDLLRAEGLEEQVGYFGRHISVDQAISEFMQTTRPV